MGNIHPTEFTVNLNEYVAVADSTPHSRTVIRRVLSGLEVPSTFFESTEALVRALNEGEIFSMVIVSFKSELRSARRELAELCRHLDPLASMLVIATMAQIELSSEVLGNERGDILLLPASEAELYERIECSRCLSEVGPSRSARARAGPIPGLGQGLGLEGRLTRAGHVLDRQLAAPR
jgi:DNA-binding NtrC family response regulator